MLVLHWYHEGWLCAQEPWMLNSLTFWAFGLDLLILMEPEKCGNDTKRQALIYWPWFDLFRKGLKRKIAVAYRRGGGRWGGQHMGECRLELAWLSKLCHGSPHQTVSRSQAEAVVFGLQLWGGWEAEARCLVISHRNVICVFTAQGGLSQARTLNPVL